MAHVGSELPDAATVGVFSHEVPQQLLSRTLELCDAHLQRAHAAADLAYFTQAMAAGKPPDHDDADFRARMDTYTGYLGATTVSDEAVRIMLESVPDLRYLFQFTFSHYLQHLHSETLRDRPTEVTMNIPALRRYVQGVLEAVATVDAVKTLRYFTMWEGERRTLAAEIMRRVLYALSRGALVFHVTPPEPPAPEAPPTLPPPLGPAASVHAPAASVHARMASVHTPVASVHAPAAFVHAPVTQEPVEAPSEDDESRYTAARTERSDAVASDAAASEATKSDATKSDAAKSGAGSDERGASDAGKNEIKEDHETTSNLHGAVEPEPAPSSPSVARSAPPVLATESGGGPPANE
jgi:hypothetical protein